LLLLAAALEAEALVALAARVAEARVDIESQHYLFQRDQITL
jgi:hypothetical protein